MTEMERTYALSLKGVCKSLDNIDIGPLDMKLEAGYVVAVVGTNGAGKSSLFRMLTNTMKPQAGEIQIMGMQYPKDEIAIKQQLGYVPEAEGWGAMGFTAVQELTDFVSQWYPSWDDAYAKRLMREFGLAGSQKLESLSKGMKRKLAFIHAIAFNPEVLLLDEPTSGLDAFAWKAMMDEIVRFMSRGQRTVLMATHILEEVKRMADIVVFTHRGKLLGQFDKDALLDEWKSFWIERPQRPISQLAGAAAIEEQAGGLTVKVISRSAGETEAALRQAGILIMQTKAVELDEVLRLLISEQGFKEGVEAS